MSLIKAFTSSNPGHTLGCRSSLEKVLLKISQPLVPRVTGKAPIWVLRSLRLKIQMELHLVLLMGGEWSAMSTAQEEIPLLC